MKFVFNNENKVSKRFLLGDIVLTAVNSTQ